MPNTCHSHSIWVTCIWERERGRGRRGGEGREREGRDRSTLIDARLCCERDRAILSSSHLSLSLSSLSLIALSPSRARENKKIRTHLDIFWTVIGAQATEHYREKEIKTEKDNHNFVPHIWFSDKTGWLQCLYQIHFTTLLNTGSTTFTSSIITQFNSNSAPTHIFSRELCLEKMNWAKCALNSH